MTNKTLDILSTIQALQAQLNSLQGQMNSLTAALLKEQSDEQSDSAEVEYSTEEILKMVKELIRDLIPNQLLHSAEHLGWTFKGKDGLGYAWVKTPSANWMVTVDTYYPDGQTGYSVQFARVKNGEELPGSFTILSWGVPVMALTPERVMQRCERYPFRGEQEIRQLATELSEALLKLA